MDPDSLPQQERARSAREFNCPYCGAVAMRRCTTSSGEVYKEHHYVHIDRLINMYRDAYVNRRAREEQADMVGWMKGRTEGVEIGRKEGWEQGWAAGAMDARYTFENTPIYRNCRSEQRLAGQMDSAGLAAPLAFGQEVDDPVPADNHL